MNVINLDLPEIKRIPAVKMQLVISGNSVILTQSPNGQNKTTAHSVN